MKTTIQLQTSRVNKIKGPSLFHPAAKAGTLSIVESYLKSHRKEQDVTFARLCICLLDNDELRLKNLHHRITKYHAWLSKVKVLIEGADLVLIKQLIRVIQEEYKLINLISLRSGFSEGINQPGLSTIFHQHLYVLYTNCREVAAIQRDLFNYFFNHRQSYFPLSPNLSFHEHLLDDKLPFSIYPKFWHRAFPTVFPQKDKQGFHVVLTTHNSRTSKRMIRYRVKKGPPLLFTLGQEIELTRIMGEVIREYGFNCLAYNVCRDHLHLILVCEPSELSYLVKIIKGKSSFLLRRSPIFNGFKPVENGGGGRKHVWSQKFFRANLDVWVLGPTCTEPGYLQNDSYLNNATRYIRNNRIKHKLPRSGELEQLIEAFIVTQDLAFQPEYKGGFDLVIRKQVVQYSY